MTTKTHSNVTGAIGNTPLVRLGHLEPGNGTMLWAKLELLNPGGSVKDRIAFAMVTSAEERGILQAGQAIVEPTSGNTGIGLAMVAAARGYRMVATMPESMSRERRELLRWLGAELRLTPASEGMSGAIALAEELARQDGFWMPGQFTNPANPRVHYETTGPELLSQAPRPADVLVLGVGTGGTLTGVGSRLREAWPNLRIVAVEPSGSAVLSGGEKGPHGIQGIGAGFVPDVLDRSLIDDVVTVADEEALANARLLAQKEGIFAGLSSGAAVCAARTVAERNSNQLVLTLLPDSGSRYLSVFNA